MSDFLLKLKGYRTVIVQGLVFVTSLLVLFGVIQPTDVQSAADAAAAQASNTSAGTVGAVVSALAMIMRLFTTTSLGTKS